MSIAMHQMGAQAVFFAGYFMVFMHVWLAGAYSGARLIRANYLSMRII